MRVLKSFTVRSGYTQSPQGLDSLPCGWEGFGSPGRRGFHLLGACWLLVGNTWIPKVCLKTAFMIIIMGYYFTNFWRFR